MTNAPATVRATAIAVVSMLDEPAGANSATRTLAGRAVLAHTLDRVRAAAGIDAPAVLAWDDQLAAIAAADATACVRSLGPRDPSPAMRARAAALRWTDAWRGGPLGTTEFDRGFHADAILAAMAERHASHVVLVSPSAALIDDDLIARLLTTLAANADGYAFAAGTPGSGAIALDREAIEDLKQAGRGPGLLLAYHPDRARHDPLAKSPSVAVAPSVARSPFRLSVDSDRQSRRLSLAQADEPALDGIDRVARLAARDDLDAMPREVTIELTARRLTRPTFSPLAKYRIDRPDLSLDDARRLFGELATVDDVRVTFAGVGDPLLYDRFGDVLAVARASGIRAIHVETDLLVDRAAELIGGGVDLVSVHLPAVLKSTYASVMNADRIDDVLANVKALLIARGVASQLPIVVPTFVKLAANLGEMESWYDQWIRAFGGAAIVGPSDFGGTIAYAGVADMTPPARVPCRQLRSRLMVLSDGAIVACEQDVFGRKSLGRLGETTVATAWSEKMRPIRQAHADKRWAEATPSCGACRMWDRP